MLRMALVFFSTIAFDEREGHYLNGAMKETKSCCSPLMRESACGLADSPLRLRRRNQHHSSRRVSAGSTRLARRDGAHAAASAVAASTVATTANVSGSWARMP